MRRNEHCLSGRIAADLCRCLRQFKRDCVTDLPWYALEYVLAKMCLAVGPMGMVFM